MGLHITNSGKDPFPSFFMPLIAGCGTVGQGTWATQVLAQQYYNIFTHSGASHANGDNISFPISIPAGTYTYYFIVAQDSSFGKLDLKIGGVTVASGIDLYAAGTTYNVIKTGSIIVAADAKNSTLTIAVNGKNAASSSYSCYMSGITLVRTA